MLSIFLILLALPIIFISSAFASVSQLEAECISPFVAYLIFAFVGCITICSIVCFLITAFQCIDYFYVRWVYRRHHPRYQNRDVAALLCLS
ncbi:RID-alpha [Simian adenovirus 16]|uniref:RID-alpha n=1 Tax=Simian adenovirus 16 TaxID=1715778 RepID=A0A0M4MEY8_9ADEN|nr:RID-alpha [Simian adenovirus 16]ALE30408.1 RID-alpha [Simian adenovirus 16]